MFLHGMLPFIIGFVTFMKPNTICLIEKMVVIWKMEDSSVGNMLLVR